jgi:hypothetical protein
MRFKDVEFFRYSKAELSGHAHLVSMLALAVPGEQVCFGIFGKQYDLDDPRSQTALVSIVRNALHRWTYFGTADVCGMVFDDRGILKVVKPRVEET